MLRKLQFKNFVEKSMKRSFSVERLLFAIVYVTIIIKTLGILRIEKECIIGYNVNEKNLYKDKAVIPLYKKINTLTNTNFMILLIGAIKI